MSPNRITLVCQFCGREVLLWPSQAATRRFCSRKCAAKTRHPRPPYPPAAERFWANVRRTDDLFACWLWTAAADPSGYGVLRVGEGKTKAHRFSWELHYGPIPEGQCVLHRCDVPRCVRPDHLWLGSRAENNADRGQKGRTRVPKGQEHHKSRLTEQQVLEIRARYAAGGVSQHGLATEYRVTRGIIAAIVRRETWKHLTE